MSAFGYLVQSPAPKGLGDLKREIEILLKPVDGTIDFEDHGAYWQATVKLNEFSLEYQLTWELYKQVAANPEGFVSKCLSDLRKQVQSD